jgi:hypothetical protein
MHECVGGIKKCFGKMNTMLASHVGVPYSLEPHVYCTKCERAVRGRWSAEELMYLKPD